MTGMPDFLLPASLLLLAALPLAAAAPPEAPAPATGFVEVPDGKLWYEVRGQGTPLVFLHDGLLPSETWDAQIPFFSRSFRTVRYDRRGHGRSEPPKGPYSDVEDLSAVFAALRIDRAVLIGCSNGSKLAVDFTLAHPEQVQGLVLVGPVVSGMPYSEHMLRRGMENYRPMFREQSLEKMIEAWVQDPYFVASGNATAKERLRELLTRFPGSLTLTDSRPADRPALPRLGEIRKLTLILVGASDIPDVHAHAGALAAGIDRARRVVVAGAGHLVQMEAPELFNETVLGFVGPGLAAAAWLKTMEGDRTWEEGRPLFDYDATAPLDVREAGTEKRGDIRVVDLSYSSALGGRVPAYLVLPAGEGKHPAVLFLHPGQGNRSTFVDEAVDLAGRGIVSLTIGAPFTRPESPKRSPFDPEGDRGEQIQTIVDARRGFDLLAARPEVDPGRLAYVGHSLGATVGGTLAGVERRPLGFVLMAGFPSLTRANTHGTGRPALAFQELLTPEERAAWVKALAPIDAVRYVGHAAPAKLLFQFAHRDEFITYFDAAAYLEAASEPKEVQWYDTGHFFNEEARKRRDEWLVKLLIP